MRQVPYNQKNTSDYFLLSDSSGIPKTGVLSTDVVGSYVRQNGARVAITLSALGSVTAAYSAGGFIEIDATNTPGLYRFDIPDAAFTYAVGVNKLYVELKPVVSVFKAEAKEFYLVPPITTEGSTTQTGANPYTFSDGTVRLDN